MRGFRGSRIDGHVLGLLYVLGFWGCGIWGSVLAGQKCSALQLELVPLF